MSYVTFKELIQGKLQDLPKGLTWAELRDALKLPYQRPCPEWTRRLEHEIGLVRKPGPRRAFLWTLRSKSLSS